MKKKSSDVTPLDVLYKTQELLDIASNRYKITVQVANKAKRKIYEDVNILSDFRIKPVVRAIIEMHDEVNVFYSKRDDES
jgi:DNA-directed RNA polymerase subunit omega